MSRRTALALTLSLFTGSIGGAAHASEPPPDQSFAPVYEGPHVQPLLRLPQQPADIEWSTPFEEDARVVVNRYEWYTAELVLLVDASGQVRDILITESMPTKNLSASMVEELRHKQWSPGMTPTGPVPAMTRFRIVYFLQGTRKSLDRIGRELRRDARAGKAGPQYILSRLMKSSAMVNHEGFDADDLLRRAAEGGSPRAMLTLGADQGEDAKEDRVREAARNRAFLLRSAQTGLGTAQLLVAFHAWAEKTDAGYARARHWLELAEKAKEPGAAKYLAALLVSHSSNPADWKRARELAEAASKDWHDKSDPDTHQVLAAACALLGDFRSAEQAQTNAIALADKVAWLTTEMEHRLGVYRASRTVTDEVVMIPVVAREAFAGLVAKP